MSFSAQWLTLREPYDLAARNGVVLEAVVRNFADRTSLGIVDLACGTGSTMRALAPHLEARQDWRLADNDFGLLSQAANRKPPPGAHVTTVAVDLARDVELALDGPLDLITTSALLDLVSPAWLERLAVEAAARRLPVYAALSYDGRVRLEPDDPLDAAVVSAVNAHQHRNKGFGPALGPDAAAAAIARFKSIGYAVVDGESDWRFGPQDRAIQQEIVSGWAAAAREVEKGPSARDVDAWLARRRALITDGRSAIGVGHVDFFAQPIGTR